MLLVTSSQSSVCPPNIWIPTIWSLIFIYYPIVFKSGYWLIVVDHTCNLSYSGGRELEEDCSSRPAQVKTGETSSQPTS
jgi:hypothetical protein